MFIVIPQVFVDVDRGVDAKSSSLQFIRAHCRTKSKLWTVNATGIKSTEEQHTLNLKNGARSRSRCPVLCTIQIRYASLKWTCDLTKHYSCIPICLRINCDAEEIKDCVQNNRAFVPFSTFPRRTIRYADKDFTDNTLKHKKKAHLITGVPSEQCSTLSSGMGFFRQAIILWMYLNQTLKFTV